MEVGFDVVDQRSAATSAVANRTGHVLREFAVAVDNRKATVWKLQCQCGTMNPESFSDRDVVVNRSIVVRVFAALPIKLF